MRAPAVPQELDHGDHDRRARCREWRRAPPRPRSRPSTARIPSAGCDRCERRSANSNRPIAAAITTAASAGVGKMLQQVGRDDQQQRDGQRAHDAGQLRPGAGGFGHRRARRAAADRKALEEPGSEVGERRVRPSPGSDRRACATAPHRCAKARSCRRTKRAPRRGRPSRPARGRRDRSSGNVGVGKPCGSGPSTDTPARAPGRTTRPRWWRRRRRSRVPGTRGQRLSTRISTSAPAPIASATTFVFPASTPSTIAHA